MDGEKKVTRSISISPSVIRRVDEFRRGEGWPVPSFSAAMESLVLESLERREREVKRGP